MVRINLDNLCIAGPVIHAVLSQRAERTETRTQRQYHIRF